MARLLAFIVVAWLFLIMGFAYEWMLQEWVDYLEVEQEVPYLAGLLMNFLSFIAVPLLILTGILSLIF